MTIYTVDECIKTSLLDIILKNDLLMCLPYNYSKGGLLENEFV